MTSRPLLLFVLALLPLAMTAAGARAADAPTAEKYWVFIGTGGGKLAKGIYRCELDAATGKLSPAELAAEIPAPGFLALHPNGKFLYCIGGVNIDGKAGSGVTAFTLDAATGKLTKLNQQRSGGNGPCHIAVDPSGKCVLTANYGDGTADVYPLADGKLGEMSDHVKHSGKGANPKRQEGPHAHSANVSKDGKFAMVADLGLDKVLVYKLDAAAGKLTPNDPPAVATAPGAGPRHFAFHPNRKLAFVINELDSTLSSLSYDEENGVLKTLKTVSTLPKDFKGNNTTAEVVVHPSGKFVYGSNRGHDSIAAFKLDQKTGDLTFVGHATEGVKEPRNFNIDPTGKWLVVGSQNGNKVVSFAIDPETGALKSTGQSIEVGAPICIKFVPITK
jgi:6-phosphogluconolactonase